MIIYFRKYKYFCIFIISNDKDDYYLIYYKNTDVD